MLLLGGGKQIDLWPFRSLWSFTWLTPPNTWSLEADRVQRPLGLLPGALLINSPDSFRSWSNQKLMLNRNTRHNGFLPDQGGRGELINKHPRGNTETQGPWALVSGPLHAFKSTWSPRHNITNVCVCVDFFLKNGFYSNATKHSASVYILQDHMPCFTRCALWVTVSGSQVTGLPYLL